MTLNGDRAHAPHKINCTALALLAMFMLVTLAVPRGCERAGKLYAYIFSLHGVLGASTLKISLAKSMGVNYRRSDT